MLLTWKLLARAEQQLRTAPGDLSSRVGTAVTTCGHQPGVGKRRCMNQALSVRAGLAKEERAAAGFKAGKGKEINTDWLQGKEAGSPSAVLCHVEDTSPQIDT
eukprot:scaffold55432_cov20-Tisochrysis_lutea.AAC.2